jgi:DNA (cytosine-5)-methyltransferase 1
MSNFTFIDLFAGIGGFHQALKELGGKCIFASEIDKYACDTYEVNHGMRPQGDITKIDAQNIPDHDILCAGFPCQPFSVAGKREGFNDTRGTLFFEIIRILKAKQPKAFILENVKGLKNHNNGETLKAMLKELVDAGYVPSWRILNTKDHGIPQNRERIFIVAIKTTWAYFKFPEPQEPITLSEFFGGNWNTDTTYTIRKGGRSSGINDRHNWDSYRVDGSIKRLTPHECALLQGFPKDFIIPVSDSQAYKQFGNAVSVNVVRKIAKNIIKELE